MAKKDLQLLQWIHKNAEMGCLTIPQVLNLTEDPKLAKVLQSQFREYDSISSESARMVREKGKKPHDPSPFSLAMSDMMLRFRSSGKDATSRLSEMMIRGSTMGTIQMTKRLKDCPDADGNLQALGKRLLQTEERNIQELKKLL